MQITEISVRNFRSIDRSIGVKLPIGNVTVLAGPNDCGKTSILLSAYAGLMGIFGPPKGRNINLRMMPDQHNRMSRDEPTSVDVVIHFTREDYEILISKFESARVFNKTFGYDEVIGICASMNCKFSVRLDSLFDDNGNFMSDEKSRISIINESMDAGFISDQISEATLNSYGVTESGRTAFVDNFVQATFRSPDVNWKGIFDRCAVVYIPANRQIDFEQMSRYGNSDDSRWYKEQSEFRLGTDSRELIRLIESLVDIEGREGALSEYLGIVRGLLSVDNVSVKATSLGRDAFVQVGNKSQPLHRSGSGLSNVLYIAGRIISTEEVNGRSPLYTICLLDEPENGLHPGLQSKLARLFKEVSRRQTTQWVVSTHSPFIMSEIDPANDDSLISLKQDSGMTSARTVQLSEQLYDLYDGLGFYLPSVMAAKGIVFCEGTSETRFISKCLETLAITVGVGGISIVPLGGKNLENFTIKDLLTIHPRCVLILDKDTGDSSDLLRKFLDDEDALAVDENFDKGEWKTETGAGKVPVFSHSVFRTLENSYDPDVVRRALDCVAAPCWQPNDEWDTLRSKINSSGPRNVLGKGRKTWLAVSVSDAMSAGECLQHPIVKFVSAWNQEFVQGAK